MKKIAIEIKFDKSITKAIMTSFVDGKKRRVIKVNGEWIKMYHDLLEKILAGQLL